MPLLSEAEARLEAFKAEIASTYSRLWQQILQDWQQPGPDRAWLLYSANYLFRTGGVRWALDPLTLNHRVPGAPAVDFGHDLARLSIALLTHRHQDHLDPGLIHELSGLPIRWIVPEDLAETVRQAGVPAKQIVQPRPLEPMEMENLRITPFEGLHWESAPERPEGRRGVPAIGYCMEWDGKCWLFPVDVRTFAADRLPRLGRLDGAFVHLWLGRGAALEEEPPQLEAFCRFCLDIGAPRIVLTHLWELGRSVDECWTDRHAERVLQRLKVLAPGMEVRMAKLGECVDL